MVIRVIFGSEPCDIFVMADSDDESGKMHLNILFVLSAVRKQTLKL